jgi:hypothetical protein
MSSDVGFLQLVSLGSQPFIVLLQHDYPAAENFGFVLFLRLRVRVGLRVRVRMKVGVMRRGMESIRVWMVTFISFWAILACLLASASALLCLGSLGSTKLDCDWGSGFGFGFGFSGFRVFGFGRVLWLSGRIRLRLGLR